MGAVGGEQRGRGKGFRVKRKRNSGSEGWQSVYEMCDATALDYNTGHISMAKLVGIKAVLHISRARTSH